jgi:hypothetical protein
VPPQQFSANEDPAFCEGCTANMLNILTNPTTEAKSLPIIYVDIMLDFGVEALTVVIIKSTVIWIGTLYSREKA